MDSRARSSNPALLLRAGVEEDLFERAGLPGQRPPAACLSRRSRRTLEIKGRPAYCGTAWCEIVYSFVHYMIVRLLTEGKLLQIKGAVGKSLTRTHGADPKAEILPILPILPHGIAFIKARP